MSVFFNGNVVSIEKVENGWIVEGNFNFIHEKRVYQNFDDVIEILWKSLSDKRENIKVGEKCPYLSQNKNK